MEQCCGPSRVAVSIWWAGSSADTWLAVALKRLVSAADVTGESEPLVVVFHTYVFARAPDSHRIHFPLPFFVLRSVRSFIREKFRDICRSAGHPAGEQMPLR